MPTDKAPPITPDNAEQLMLQKEALGQVIEILSKFNDDQRKRILYAARSFYRQPHDD